ncbi:LANO_0A05292g1_1 [Lachancea nothofagi CBS 11611]|uniref:LANO_0A05292g1_1 n=1 Tax=Lachancea nothofagi CBS 11611 TaxID=1266666 RepID=A0A1G4IR01_9SACH|nr:LANO_0A05292g1_1 [Lachancea nothofagi CBS 11611]
MTVSTTSLPEPSYTFQATVDAAGPQVVGGKGVRISIEKEGQVYDDMLDAISGAAVGSLGWGDEDVFEIINNAARSSTYSYPPLITNKAAEALSKFFVDNSPKGAFAAALWCCSGSESNDNAIRIIRQYYLERGLPNKVKLISRASSYHGFTLGAQSISWNPRVDAYEPYLMDREKIVIQISPAYSYRFKKDAETEEAYSQRLIDELEKKILDNDPDTIASVTVETLPGSSLGTCPPPKGYLKGIRDLCNKYDLIFHLDEVMCGTGRSNPNGKLHCWENFLEPCDAPDIQTVGKTLGSGYVTIAGVLVGPKIRDVYLSGSNSVAGGHTYSSHAFNCAVALGIQEKIKKENLTANIFEMGNLMGQKLKDALLSKSNIAGDVRGIGGFWSIEFVKDRATKEPFDCSLNVGGRFKAVCFDNKLCVMGMPGNPDGSCGDRALLAPSFIITEEIVDEIVEKVVKSVDILSKQLHAEGAW